MNLKPFFLHTCYTYGCSTFAIILTTTFFAQAQIDTVHLTLKDCIRIGQQQGPLTKISQSAFNSKEHHYKSYFAGFLPQLSLRGDAPGFDRSINSISLDDGSTIYQAQRQATSSLSLSLAQRIPYTGTEISINSGLNRLDNLETNTAYYRSTPLTFSLRQPLFSINSLAWTSDQEDLRYRTARREYVEAMEDAAIDITNKFFGFYLASMNVNNSTIKLAINDTLFQMSKGRYTVGKIAENDLLQSELALLNARTQKEDADLEYERAEQNLRFALSLPQSTKFVVHEDESISMMPVDPQKALSYARQNRSDEVNFELQKLTAARTVRQARSDNFISMSIWVNVGLNQKATELKDAYSNMLDQQQFSVQFQMPLIGWGTGSHAVESALAEQSRVENSIETQQFSFDQEVLYQVRRFQLLQSQVGFAAKADTVAQRRFDVAHKRFVIGKIDIPNLFLAQSERDNAYQARIKTVWDYWTTFYQLRRLTLYDFATQRTLIEE